MVMVLILLATGLLSGYGILQNKKTGNVFGFAFSAFSFVFFLFCTVLALVI
ncbi:hypothetical protein [Ammoniphilus sp. CFH 90114]|uniref:hypothetical protein n=1 Tax=Ammoniphilus sp. CFH 90114 TaxID=2493665 RepID=UPI0013E94D1C|nr:hypothetical protein [Ammoniphilus sp. CFH 90114]